MPQRWFDYGRWFARAVVRQFVEHRCLNSAAALTFTTLLALVPIMMVTYMFLAAVPELSALGKTVEAFVFETFVPNASAVLSGKLSEFSAQAGQLGALSFAMVVLTAILALINIEEVFNVIWRAPAPRSGWQRLLVYWGVLSIGPPLLIGSLLATSYIYALPLISDIDAFGVRELILSMLPTLAITATFTILYFAVPNVPVRFAHALAGGLLTMLLFEAARWLFAEFVARSFTTLVYGTFAAVPFFLTWLYLVWIMVLGGAVFVRTLSMPRGTGNGERRTPKVLQCVRVIAALNEAHLQGESLSANEIEAAVPLDCGERHLVFDLLTREGLLQATANGRFALGRSLKTITLWDLHRQLPETLDADQLASVKGPGGVAKRLAAFAQIGAQELDVSLDSIFSETRQGR